jgi:hypothetical protein
MMNLVRGVYRFLYDFIIGDDWKIAAAVVLSLALGFVLMGTDVPSSTVAVATALLVAAAFTIALVIDVRRS